MTDPLSRLRAGLAEDERIARAAIDHEDGSAEWSFVPDLDDALGDGHLQPHDLWFYYGADADHIARQDPKATLDRVEAIRKALGERERANRILRESQGLVGSSSSQTYWEGYQDACDAVIAALASIYPEPTETGDTQ
ncbi:DUF6221 family protein [Nocardia beijingensis]